MMQFKGATAWFAGCGFAECAVPSPSITSDAALRVAVDCLARTVCRGRTLHVAALVAPGGLACCLSARVASHRPLHPSLSVPISRLPEPVRFIRHGYPALPVTIDRLPGSIRVNRPLSATRRIIICRRRSQSLHLRLHRVRRKQSPCRTFVANREGPSTNLHESTCISIRENSCQFVDRTRKAKAVARPSRLRTRQARPSCIFAGSKGCTFSVVFLYTSTLIRSLSFASPAGNGSSQPANQLRRFTFCVEDRFFSCCPRKNPSWRTS